MSRRWCEQTGKYKYPSELEAQLALLSIKFSMRNEDQKQERAICATHPCEHCEQWHLTGKKPDGKYRRGLGDAIRSDWRPSGG